MSKEEIQSVLVRLLEEASHHAPLTEKEIIKHVRIPLPEATKKQVRKALNELENSKEIDSVQEGDKKKYTNAPRVRASFHASKVDERCEHTKPIAEVLRQRRAKRKRNHNENVAAEEEKEKKANDIDEEIRLLEAELNEPSDGESSDELSEDGETSQKPNEASTDGVVCLSSVAKDRIAPLPKNYLPTAKSQPLKVDRAHAEEPKQKRQKSKDVTTVSEGLKAAVKGVLDGYVARSNERLPFYCRVCAKQYNNDDEFFQHKKTDFHKAAVEMEKKASYCKLCRKQLTSPVQLKEHLHSKPHKERLRTLRNRQQKDMK